MRNDSNQALIVALGLGAFCGLVLLRQQPSVVTALVLIAAYLLLAASVLAGGPLVALAQALSALALAALFCREMAIRYSEAFALVWAVRYRCLEIARERVE